MAASVRVSACECGLCPMRLRLRLRLRLGQGKKDGWMGIFIRTGPSSIIVPKIPELFRRRIHALRHSSIRSATPFSYLLPCTASTGFRVISSCCGLGECFRSRLLTPLEGEREERGEARRCERGGKGGGVCLITDSCVSREGPTFASRGRAVSRSIFFHYVSDGKKGLNRKN